MQSMQPAHISCLKGRAAGQFTARNKDGILGTKNAGADMA
jgi:hypothetical protein